MKNLGCIHCKHYTKIEIMKNFLTLPRCKAYPHTTKDVITGKLKSSPGVGNSYLNRNFNCKKFESKYEILKPFKYNWFEKLIMKLKGK